MEPHNRIVGLLSPDAIALNAKWRVSSDERRLGTDDRASRRVESFARSCWRGCEAGSPGLANDDLRRCGDRVAIADGQCVGGASARDRPEGDTRAAAAQADSPGHSMRTYKPRPPPR